MTNDGPKHTETEMDIANRELQAEENLWAEAGISLDGVNVTGIESWAYGQKIATIVTILVEKGICTQDELNLAMKRHLKQNMEILRHAIMEHRTAQKPILVPERDKTIYGPSGQPLWFEK